MQNTENNAFQASLRDKVMGIIVLTALLAVVYLFIYGAEFWDAKLGGNNYYTELSQSFGIIPGGEVSLSGVRVGSVQGVALQEDGQVLVRLYLSPDFSSFYRQGSKLQIDNKMALGNVISGNSLIFVPANAGDGQIAPGSFIPAIEPQSLDDLMKEWNVRELAKTLQKIVTNMNEVVSAINDNQAKLIDTLTHSAEVSANMAEATAQIPQLVADFNTLLVNVNNTIEQLGGDATTMSSEVASVMENTKELTASLNLLAESMAPTAEKSPILMDNLIHVSRETEVLLNKLNRHWLLGGAEAARVPSQRLDLPPDDALYNE